MCSAHAGVALTAYREESCLFFSFCLSPAGACYFLRIIVHYVMINSYNQCDQIAIRANERPAYAPFSFSSSADRCSLFPVYNPVSSISTRGY